MQNKMRLKDENADLKGRLEELEEKHKSSRFVFRDLAKFAGTQIDNFEM